MNVVPCSGADVASIVPFRAQENLGQIAGIPDPRFIAIREGCLYVNPEVGLFRTETEREIKELSKKIADRIIRAEYGNPAQAVFVGIELLTILASDNTSIQDKVQDFLSFFNISSQPQQEKFHDEKSDSTCYSRRIQEGKL